MERDEHELSIDVENCRRRVQLRLESMTVGPDGESNGRWKYGRHPPRSSKGHEGLRKFEKKVLSTNFISSLPRSRIEWV